MNKTPYEARLYATREEAGEAYHRAVSTPHRDRGIYRIHNPRLESWMVVVVGDVGGGPLVGGGPVILDAELVEALWDRHQKRMKRDRRAVELHHDPGVVLAIPTKEEDV